MALIKGKYRVFNEAGEYDIVHLETEADQVITNTDKQFTSQAEKNKWDAKSDAHTHPYRGNTWVPSWNDVTSKPTSFTPSGHKHPSSDIDVLTGYAKPASAGAITTADSLNTAIGKLEKALDGKQASGSYEPANANIQAHIKSAHLALGTTSSTAFRGDYGNTAYSHSQAAHAPSNAQKNSDITKAEIEAKLTGAITTHTHNYETSAGAQSKADAALSSAKTYADQKVSALVGSAPEALDTLQELAAAIEGNQAGVSDLLGIVGTKADTTYVNAELAKKAEKTHAHAWGEITGKPAFATVATSGSYNDLSNKPTIPTNGSFSLTGLSDTTISSAANGQLLRYNGTKWVNWTPNYLTSHAVSSVAGKTGAVTLAKADVGLGSVDNTADVNKNVNSAKTLTTSRTINGVAFNGSANITVPSITTVSSTAPTAPATGQIWIELQ